MKALLKGQVFGVVRPYRTEIVTLDAVVNPTGRFDRYGITELNGIKKSANF